MSPGRTCEYPHFLASPGRGRRSRYCVSFTAACCRTRPVSQRGSKGSEISRTSTVFHGTGYRMERASCAGCSRDRRVWRQLCRYAQRSRASALHPTERTGRAGGRSELTLLATDHAAHHLQFNALFIRTEVLCAKADKMRFCANVLQLRHSAAHPLGTQGLVTRAASTSPGLRCSRLFHQSLPLYARAECALEQRA